MTSAFVEHDSTTGSLIVCPTPIGHWDDLTVRVVEALREADLVACEDTRRAGLLLSHLQITRPLTSLHEQNEARRVGGLLERIAGGETVALISDAGTPAVSDPGFLLIRAVIEADLELVVLPGPSAVITAVVASGLPLDSWTFLGFLPRKRGALTAALSGDDAFVAFESPRRLAQTLDLLSELEPTRLVAVCRELTKTHEQIVRGPVSEVAARFQVERPLGEIVIVAAPSTAPKSLAPALDAVETLVEAGAQPATAVAVAAELEDVGQKELHATWLRESRRGGSQSGY
jgi:16S rRNA (cytidine1402-2'-O)-methyltransferase